MFSQRRRELEEGGGISTPGSRVLQDTNFVICAISEKEECLGSLDATKPLLLSRQFGIEWVVNSNTTETETDVICNEELSLCLTKQDTETDLILTDGTNPTEFRVIPFEFLEDFLIVQLSVASLCLTKDLDFSACTPNIDDSRDLDDLKKYEIEQLFLLVGSDQDIPDLGLGNNNNNGDDERVRIGVLIFQVMLFVGFFLVGVAFVYKYDMIPESIRQRYYRMTDYRRGVSPTELAEITADAKNYAKEQKQIENQEQNGRDETGNAEGGMKPRLSI